MDWRDVDKAWHDKIKMIIKNDEELWITKEDSWDWLGWRMAGKGSQSPRKRTQRERKKSDESLFSFSTFNLPLKKKKKKLCLKHNTDGERERLWQHDVYVHLWPVNLFFISLCTQPKALNICARYLGWDPCFYIILLTFIRPTN